MSETYFKWRFKDKASNIKDSYPTRKVLNASDSLHQIWTQSIEEAIKFTLVKSRMKSNEHFFRKLLLNKLLTREVKQKQI